METNVSEGKSPIYSAINPVIPGSKNLPKVIAMHETRSFLSSFEDVCPQDCTLGDRSRSVNKGYSCSLLH